MSRWSFGAPVANLLVAAFGALALLGAGPAGALWITTLPSGADVWLDGIYVGQSPLVVDALAVGDHKLTLTRTGWNPQDLTATVAPAQTLTEAVVMTRELPRLGGSGSIAIHGLHPDSIAIDGAATALPKDGVIAVPTGTHELAFITAQGRQTRTVTVYPQTRTDVILSTEGPARSAVVAPADDYLPAGSYHLDGTQIVAHFGGHDVIAKLGTTEVRVDGRATSYDAAPTLINGRLFLPIDLLTFLNPPVTKK